MMMVVLMVVMMMMMLRRRLDGGDCSRRLGRADHANAQKMKHGRPSMTCHLKSICNLPSKYPRMP